MLLGLASGAQAQTDITRNPGFETGRGSTPLGNPYAPLYPNWQLFAVDVVGGDYNPLDWRVSDLDEVQFFIPGEPSRDQANTFDPTTIYRPFDWWFGEGARFVGADDVADVLNPPAGYANQVSPLAGDRMLRFSNTGAKFDEACSVYQDFNVDAFSDLITSGTATVTVTGHFNKNAEDDQAGARLEVSFYRSDKALISTITGADNALDLDPATWQPVALSTSIPYGTRFVRVHLAAVGQNMLKWGVDNTSGGAYIGTYADSVSVTIGDLPTETDQVLFWALDEDSGPVALDSSGSGNDGNISGASRAVGYRAGGAQIAGIDQVVSLNDDVTSGVFPCHASAAANDFTIAAWVRRAATGQQHPIAAKQGTREPGPNRGFVFEVAADDRLRLELSRADDSDADRSEVYSTETIPGDAWVHVAATYQFVTNGTSRVRLYINGSPSGASDAVVGPPQANAQPFEAGRSWWSAEQQANWDGSLDEVRVYRRALAPAEVADLMVLRTTQWVVN